MEQLIGLLLAIAAVIVLLLLFLTLKRSLADSLKQMETRLSELERSNEQKLDNMRETMERRLAFIQRDTGSHLETMEGTVEKKLSAAFGLMSSQLEQVHKGLGEMQGLASGVGDLKRVLSNVKTRGILGELQLAAILEEVLTPDQYEKNVPTVPGSRAVVEFALKLPSGEDSFTYLPIDSKFPSDAYHDLIDAQSSGEKPAVEAAEKELTARLLRFARDIHEKYIHTPETTEFGIMFLPFEGLYCEAVRLGLIEQCQSRYRINIAGPSTMAALLNTVRMMFRSIAISRRSDEVWQLLANVQEEFDKFESTLTSVRQRLNQADTELDKLVGVRTRMIKKQLREVENFKNDSSKS